MFNSISQYLHLRVGPQQLLTPQSDEPEADAPGTEEEERPPVAGGTVGRTEVRVGTPELAMKVSAWFAGVRILSENAASCLLKYQRWNAAEQRFVDTEDAYDKRLFYILTVRPNKRFTRYEFYKNLYQRRINEGNVYVFIKALKGKPWEQYLLSRGTVRYDKNADIYEVRDDIQNICGRYTSNGHLEGDDGWLLHFKDFSLDGGYTGVPRIYYAATQLGILGTAARETLDGFARHGLGKYIYHDRQDAQNFTAMTDTQMADNVKDIQKQLDANVDIVISRGQGQLDPMTMDAQQLQYLSKEEFTVRDIARFLGVPLMKLFEKGDQTYKSSDAANIALYNEGLRPILEAAANEYNAKLIPWTLASTYRYWFDSTPLYLSDKMTEADYLQKRIATGTLTINEARAIMNLPPVENGDMVLTSANFKTLEMLKSEGDQRKTAGNGGNAGNGGEDGDSGEDGTEEE